MTTLHDLHEQAGQSPWIDDLKRSYLTGGGLAKLLDAGIRGMTSNPTIMAKAIEASADYDDQFRPLVQQGASVEDAYWDLVIEDVEGALAMLRPLYDQSAGGDGFVSLEVAPSVAHDTKATAEMARNLHTRINQPNLLVKIPATLAGLGAIEQMIAEGHSINVTLIFSLERYAQVIDAYIAGLQRRHDQGGALDGIASVASFFVSRVDTEVDRRLEEIAKADAGSTRAARALELRGKAALAQAQLAYEYFEQAFGAERFTALPGARRQRPLWASTSTKNPAYPDLLYVDNLIGPDTVNTMPEATVQAFLDHGIVRRSVDQDFAGAHAVMDDLAEVGIDMADVTEKLEQEGVASFAKSFDELIERLEQKAASLGAH